MRKYGSDKPDLRIKGMEITDVSDLAAQTEFKVFRDVLESGGTVRGLNAQGMAASNRRPLLNCRIGRVCGWPLGAAHFSIVDRGEYLRSCRLRPPKP